MNKIRKWYVVETGSHSCYYKDKDTFQPFDDDCLIDDFKEAQEVGIMLREKGYQTEVVLFDIEECNSADFGTLGFMFEAEAGRNKIADLEEENRVLKKTLEIAAEKIEFMAQMLGQTLDYDIKENLIRQAKESEDE